MPIQVLKHSEACWAMPRCLTCGLLKPPFGRDPGVMMSGSMCSSECSGYNEEPKPGHFWPDEEPGLLAEIRSKNANNIQDT